MMAQVHLAQPFNTALVTGSASSLTPALVVLDTGVHTSVVKIKQLPQSVYHTQT